MQTSRLTSCIYRRPTHREVIGATGDMGFWGGAPTRFPLLFWIVGWATLLLNMPRPPLRRVAYSTYARACLVLRVSSLVGF